MFQLSFFEKEDGRGFEQDVFLFQNKIFAMGLSFKWRKKELSKTRVVSDYFCFFEHKTKRAKGAQFFGPAL